MGFVRATKACNEKTAGPPREFSGNPFQPRGSPGYHSQTALRRLLEKTREAPMLRWLRFWDRRRNPPEGESRPSQAAKPQQAPSPPPPLPDAPFPVSPEHEALLRALEDPSPEARGWAVEALVRVGAPVVPALAERLRHREVYVRQAAVVALGDIGPDSAPALTALVAAAIDRDEGVRRVASAVLPRVDPAWAIAPGTRLALPAVIDGLRSGLPWISRAAAALLVRVGRPAVPALAELLADWEEKAHRQAALDVLGQIGPSAGDAALALADVLAGPETEFRQAAAATLV